VSRYQNAFALSLLLATSVLAGCVSDDNLYEQRSAYSQNFYGTPEQRDRAREARQRREARRDEIDRQQEVADLEARDHRRFCRNSPSSMFCRYD